MAAEKNILGIDVGSISISIAELDNEGNILKSSYIFHEGHIRERLEKELKSYDFSKIGGAALTSSVPEILAKGDRFDSRVCIIAAAKKLHPDVGSILIIGGEKFGLVSFDEKGNYKNYRSNTSCAAGTGSFLDQQAQRLNLGSIENFCKTAEANTGDIPKIASRCAVFAKTDLIHAQQEGFSISEICDGLCAGLAKNIADTLFSSGKPNDPLIMAGGVSKNGPVVAHLSRMIDQPIIVDEHSYIYGAVGAALLLAEKNEADNIADVEDPSELFLKAKNERTYSYPPLSLKLSTYPEFTSYKRYEFQSKVFPKATKVEVDIYEPLEEGENYPVYLGIDIGSTSTKAVLVDDAGEVKVGFYTRTSGQPVEAVQTVFETIDDICTENKCSFEFKGVGTTGSGRKFIGKIIGADVPLDEISAHARAAYSLDPEVDTIIEIGGQDAKFTTMKNGMVTFSIMNNVCAAGTGSFIEEQAKKLGCPLKDYSDRAEGVSAPMSSDRCTVFMERDLNYYLSENYSTDEVLASVLHSVRDNYLTKVAIKSNIGEKIFFQGATAKNRALVAAFEQKLEKPIMVSKFCHLTGALGVALHVRDEKLEKTSFRGIRLYKEKFPVKNEVCELCNNNCKIKLVDVGGETVAFGFLCGRDYETKKFVNENKSGFDLLRARKKLLKLPKEEPKYDFTIGIPAALNMVDEMYMWKYFFRELGVKTVTSEGYKDGIKEGKKITRAEFCAPITELHGHVMYLKDKADYIFLPVDIEYKTNNRKLRRNYCYYTNYAPTLISSLDGVIDREKILSPVAHSISGPNKFKKDMAAMLKKVTGKKIRISEISKAYEKAQKANETFHEGLHKIYQEKHSSDEVDVVLLGRPYTILSPSMNKGIPEIFGKEGIVTFFQDMIESRSESSEEIESLLEAFHWHYASHILEIADTVAKTEGLYPVFVTSFKCTPDAFTMEYFKKIMDLYHKPYLILQLDEHDSNVGYETRIEAGIRSFRNHFAAKTKKEKDAGIAAMIPEVTSKPSVMKEKILLLPKWDNILGRLMPAVLKREGIDARVVEESADSIQRSVSTNTGQCIPLNIIVQNTVDYIRKYNLDPAKCVMWNIDAKLSCNAGMFPYWSKTLLESIGGGMENVEVYCGNVTFMDVKLGTAVNMYQIYMFSGMLRRMGCRIRPYEIVKGSTDAAIEKSIQLLYKAITEDLKYEDTLEEIVSMFEKIETKKEQRPKVAIFGDIYVRDNEVLNQNIIKVIEDNGGEAVTTPYSEMLKIIAEPYIRKWYKEGSYVEATVSKMLTPAMTLFEKKYYKYFNRILNEPLPTGVTDVEKVLEMFNINLVHSGESMENALKIYALMQVHKDLAFFVQTNPAFCCPSLVTQGMAQHIEKMTGLPIVTIEYDGTGGFKNEDIIPYLKFPRHGKDAEKESKETEACLNGVA